MGRRAMTTAAAPTAASATAAAAAAGNGCRCTTFSCGECQMSSSSSTGASTSAPAIAAAWARRSRASSAPAARIATTTTPSLGIAPERTANVTTGREGRERPRADPLPSPRMCSAKLVVACGLAALALSACGSSAKPIAGSVSASGKTAGRGVIDDPRHKHVQCLEAHHLPVTDDRHHRPSDRNARGRA